MKSSYKILLATVCLAAFSNSASAVDSISWARNSTLGGFFDYDSIGTADGIISSANAFTAGSGLTHGFNGSSSQITNASATTLQNAITGQDYLSYTFSTTNFATLAPGTFAKFTSVQGASTATLGGSPVTDTFNSSIYLGTAGSAAANASGLTNVATNNFPGVGITSNTGARNTPTGLASQVFILKKDTNYELRRYIYGVDTAFAPSTAFNLDDESFGFSLASVTTLPQTPAYQTMPYVINNIGKEWVNNLPGRGTDFDFLRNGNLGKAPSLNGPAQYNTGNNGGIGANIGATAPATAPAANPNAVAQTGNSCAQQYRLYNDGSDYYEQMQSYNGNGAYFGIYPGGYLGFNCTPTPAQPYLNSVISPAQVAQAVQQVSPEQPTALAMQQPRVSVWGRYLGSSATADEGNGKAGYDSNFNGMQSGVDIPLNENIKVGLIAGTGNLNGTATASGLTSKFKTNAYAAGVSGTWSENPNSLEGQYVQVVGLYQASNYKVGQKADVDGNTYVASVETGYGLRVGDSSYIEPQAQLIYTNTGIDDFVDTDGLAVNNNNVGQLTGRVGVRAATAFKPESVESVIPYVEVNYYNNITTSNNNNTVNGLALDANEPKSFYEVKAGLNSDITESVGVFGDVGYGMGSDYDNVSGHVGVKYSW